MTSITATIDIIRIGSDAEGNTVARLTLIPSDVQAIAALPSFNEFGPTRFDIGGLPATFVNGLQRGDVLTITLAAQG